MSTRRIAPWLLVALVVSTLVVWAVVRQSSIDRPDNDDLDLLAGRPDPAASVIEEQLDWVLAVLDGQETDDREIRERFTTDFLTQISPAEFAGLTDQIRSAGPYDFFGFRLDDGGQVASALLVDRNGDRFALTITVVDAVPDQLSGLLLSEIELEAGPFRPSEFALHLGAGVVLAVAGGLVAGAGRRPRQGALLTIAGVLWLLQLLELSGVAALYTVGLVAGPFAAVAVTFALLAAPDGRLGAGLDRVVVVLAGVAAAVAIAVLGAVDTAALSLPDVPLGLGHHESWARSLVRVAGAMTAVTALAAAGAMLRRQMRSGWATSPADVPATVAGLVGGVVAAVPAVSAVVDGEGFDLSMSPVFAVVAMVVAAGVVGTALALESQELLALQASRVRIVRAGEDARRQLERDLHDGAQQRLLSVMLALRLGRDRFAGRDPELDEFLADATDGLGQAVAELRELSRGLHPAILERGVVAAAESLAETSSVPVTVVGDRSYRCPPPVEQAAYFVIAEALTNAIRHAAASHVEVRVEGTPEQISVTVTDDGCGGATPGAGTGLQGLADRASVLGGTWSLDSQIGEGTIVEVALPCV